MLELPFEDEWERKQPLVPKRNLIADHDFSSVPKIEHR